MELLLQSRLRYCAVKTALPNTKIDQLVLRNGIIYPIANFSIFKYFAYRKLRLQQQIGLLVNMFSEIELHFLTKDLQASIKLAKERLQQPEIEGKRREAIETRLIISTSILNKLAHVKVSPSKVLEREKQTVNHTDGQKNKIIYQPKVLLVDDSKMTLKMCRRFLMEVGFNKIDLAEDGKQAFQMIENAFNNDSPYELVISDWEMPRITGMDLLQMVRLNDKLWRTPFYLMTSLSDKKYIMQAINNGASGYVIKPVNVNMMKEKFLSYLTQLPTESSL